MPHSLDVGSDLDSAIHPDPGIRRPAMHTVIALGVVVSGAVALILALFVSSAVKTGPHEVAIDIVGPDSAVTGVRAALSAAGENAFSISTVGDEQTAVAHLQDRTADGAIVVGHRRTAAAELAHH